MSASSPRPQAPPQPIAIERFGLEEAPTALPELQTLLDGAYHNSHMYKDLAGDLDQAPEPFQLFIARTVDQDEVAVGVAVVEAKVHEAFDYLDLPPVHLKRFTVARALRGMGIGQRLLDECKRYAFGEVGLQGLFVESNEIGAIAMYGREGALYSRESIYEYYRRNKPGHALAYFNMAITDPIRRHERYPNGEGIRFAFARDEEAAQFLRAHGYISKDDLPDLQPSRPN